MQDAPFAPFLVPLRGLAETPSFPDCRFEPARAAAVLLSRTAALARALVLAGRTVELAGLEGQVGLLCAKALDLPPEEGRQMRTELAILLAELDALAGTLGLPVADP